MEEGKSKWKGSEVREPGEGGQVHQESLQVGEQVWSEGGQESEQQAGDPGGVGQEDAATCKHRQTQTSSSLLIALSNFTITSNCSLSTQLSQAGAACNPNLYITSCSPLNINITVFDSISTP